MHLMHSTDRRGQCGKNASVVLAVLVPLLMLLAASAASAAGALERIKASGKLTLGYRVDARPFSYRDESGNAAGYSVALCQKIAEQVKAELKLPGLSVDWVPVTMAGRFGDVQQGKIDLLCGADTETLTRRKDVSFSIAIFPGGIGALLRSDSSYRLRQVLTKGQAAAGPFWRASPAQLLEQQTFSAVAGTTGEKWLAGQIEKLQISAKVVPAENYDDGIRRVLDRSVNVFFGDRVILLEAAKRSASARDLIVIDRRFTNERPALALQRGDEDFRLLVDQTLSRLFESADFRYVYAKWFGDPDADALKFFGMVALPD